MFLSSIYLTLVGLCWGQVEPDRERLVLQAVGCHVPFRDLVPFQHELHVDDLRCIHPLREASLPSCIFPP